MTFKQLKPRQLPQPQEPIMRPDGSMSPVWFEYLLDQDRAIRAILAFLRAQFP